MSRQILKILLMILLMPPCVSAQEARELDEVTVTASRVKMVVKGDTLVYDGDAFALARGAMLRRLIDQLPAVELKSDGRIYVNGCFVSELTINGEDFFKGDNKVALENMPAYMVKNIKVYRKTDWERRFKTREEYPLVMDVTVKKEYKPGKLLNLQAGAGTSGRYLGRLFGVVYSDVSRLTVVGGVNNTNDERTPGQVDNWDPDWRKAGRATVAMGAVDYLRDFKGGRWRLETNVTARHKSSLLESDVNSERYQQGVNLLGREQTETSTRRFTLSTNNKIAYVLERFRAELTPTLSYERQRDSKTVSSTTSDAFEAQLNSLHETSREARETWRAGCGASMRWKLPGTEDFIVVKGDFSYLSESRRARSLRTLEFDLEPERNQFTNPLSLLPQRRRQANLSVKYDRDYRFTPWLSGSVGFNYRLEHDRLHTSRDYFRMELLEGQEPSMALPSVADAIIHGTFYPSNSFDYHLTDNRHTLELNIINPLPVKLLNRYEILFQARVALTAAPGQIAYEQMEHVLTKHRSPWYVDPKIGLTVKELGSLTYSYTNTLPGLLELLDVTDAADPLYIYRGNSALKAARTHQLRLIADRIFRRGPLFEAEFNRFDNMMAQSAAYDMNTGVTTYRPVNVSGNWELMGRLFYQTRLDRADRWHIEATLRAYYQNSVDLVGQAENTVRNLLLTDRLKLSFKIMRGMEITADCGMERRRASSPSVDYFTPFTAYDFDYGLRFRASELPWGLNFITDLMMHSRRGYTDASLNGNDLIWNARLAKLLLRGHMTVALDGFDILGQMSNVVQTVNSQGRTETRYNTLPRYGMLSVLYRF